MGTQSNQMRFINHSIQFAANEVLKQSQAIHPGEIEPIILQIRKEFNTINGGNVAMNKTETTSMAGNYKELFTNTNGVTKKAIEMTPNGTVEYYYTIHNKSFLSSYIKAVIENRFYFHEDQLIRWIDANRTTIDYDAGLVEQ